MDISALRAGAPPGVRFVARFIGDDELPAYFRRADLVVLPYREIDQSGVLFTALAFGKPLLLSDVGGFPEIAATGAARTFPAGDAVALRAALRELLDDERARTALGMRARELAARRVLVGRGRTTDDRAVRATVREVSRGAEQVSGAAQRESRSCSLSRSSSGCSWR